MLLRGKLWTNEIELFVLKKVGYTNTNINNIFLYSTTLQAEPVLGGRRLDLYKIFQVVAASGGFDEVTKNRGWKQVGDIFQFPSTCTNSAYILKGVYIRNLVKSKKNQLSWYKII